VVECLPSKYGPEFKLQGHHSKNKNIKQLGKVTCLSSQPCGKCKEEHCSSGPSGHKMEIIRTGTDSSGRAPA
jgi:hypothetical protein